MSFPAILILAVSLAMDAFAVSISSGISLSRAGLGAALRIAFCFGLFQAGMTLAGFFVSSSFYSYLERIDHWIAFALLSLIGIKMIVEAARNRDSCPALPSDKLGLKTLLVLALATSIDALAAGVSLAALALSIFFPALLIGTVTFALSYGGVIFGKKLGCRFGNLMEILGGSVLIILGLKILAQTYLL